MDKSSRAITLVLVGSALLLGGCEREEVANENDSPYNRGHGVFIGPRLGGGSGGVGGGGRVASAPSARGGFGATGSIGVGS